MRIPIISGFIHELEDMRLRKMPPLVLPEGVIISRTGSGKTMLSGNQISEEEFMQFARGRHVVEHPNTRGKHENE